MKLTKEQAENAKKLIEVLNVMCKNAKLSEAFKFEEKDGKFKVSFSLPEFDVQLEAGDTTKDE
jgi:hypothetical protein